MTWDRNSQRARTISAACIIASPTVGALAAVGLHSPDPMPAAFALAVIAAAIISTPAQEKTQ